MDYNKSYPKEFKNDKVIIEKAKCFFIMPFAEKYDIVYGTIQECLLNKGFLPVRVDKVSGSNAIMNKIMNEILSAQYVIVDMSELNPNVFYELGIAHCFKEARNVIIIKDKETNAPSDIRHMNYIEYDRKNLVLLKERIASTLEDIKYLSELESVLSLHKIVSVQDNSGDAIVKLLERNFTKEEIILLCYVLNKEYTIKDVENIEKLVDKFIILLRRLQAEKFEKKDIDICSGILIKLLSSSINCNFISSKINELLYSTEIFDSTVESLKFKTNLTLTFAGEGKQLNTVMPWIIEYFSQSKSTHIDLNRYNLEAFLLSSPNEEIDNIIINSVFASNRHVREHMADIINEKCLLRARSNLIIQLNREENLYSASSIIEAIGKIGQFEDIGIINKWIDIHYSEISNPGGNFIFKHAKNAIMRLDCSNNAKELTKFIEKYNNDIVY